MRRFRSAVVLAVALAAMFGGTVAHGQLPPAVGAALSAHARSWPASSPSEAGVSPSKGGVAALPAGHAWRVTLVTGDVVGVRTVSGRPPLVTIQPGPGRTGVFFSKYVDTRGHIEVLPHDVAPLVGPVLDPALFDVTTLIRGGDDDAHRSGLPLIVQGEGGTSAKAAALALSPSLRQGRVLSSIGAIAVEEPKTAAFRTGTALAAMASAATRMGHLTPHLTRRIRHVWLDQTVRVSGLRALATASAGSLDHYLVQIGATAAWRAGRTGTGVRVAVLDTGVDASHPDLKGQIVAERNFSASPGVTDRFGHGTFVAAEIAGTGRAAGGQRRGVAFGARLVIGKVLGDDGSGLDSAVIAGMQWAASRARVISMSLGGLPSDGSDPVSAAVNHLTAARHVLFVIAAGNFGPADLTVTSPAAASAALAVGAVDGQDALAAFSSRGPRLGDFAIKPEIVAPGVDIAGARAAGTALGAVLDARYTTLSGTSMATPLVAGAAAILIGMHPGWSPARIEAELVSSAHPATGGDAYAQGGGRLDIAAAVADSLTADQAIADLGTIPAGSAQLVGDKLSWTNTGRSATTARLSVQFADHQGRAAPRGAIGLSTGRIRIGPGGSASATLSVSPGQLSGHPGLYEGQVVARAGAMIIRTPISLYLAPPTRTLTLKATPLPGTAAGDMAAGATVVDLTDPDLFQASVPLGPDGTATLAVPDGHYWVIGEVDDVVNGKTVRSAMTGQPDVTVGGDTTVTLDGAASVPVTASVTGHPTQMSAQSVHLERGFAGQLFASDLYYFGPPTSQPVLYAQPTGTAHTGSFQAYTALQLISPPASPARYAYDLYHSLGNRIPASAAYVITPAGQSKLARVTERFYAIDGNTAAVGDVHFGLTATGFLAVQNNGTAPGASTRTDYFTPGPAIGWSEEAFPPFMLGGFTGLWVIEIPGFQRYAPGSTQTADWVRQPLRPGPYSATQPSVSFCAPQPTTRSRGNIHVELVDLQNLPDGFDCLGGAGGLPQWLAATSRVIRLYRDGRLIGVRREAAAEAADFTVPQAAATYRLTYDDSTSKVLPVSTRTDTSWTFLSAAPAGLGATRLPLLLVSYRLPLGLDNHPDGRTAVFTVARVAGTPSARVTGLRLWTSTDGGRSWRPALVRVLGSGRYAATLPLVAHGQAVSLRVQASDAGGSAIDQTIITAYHG